MCELSLEKKIKHRFFDNDQNEISMQSNKKLFPNNSVGILKCEQENKPPAKSQI